MVVIQNELIPTHPRGSSEAPMPGLMEEGLVILGAFYDGSNPRAQDEGVYVLAIPDRRFGTREIARGTTEEGMVLDGLSRAVVAETVHTARPLATIDVTPTASVAIMPFGKYAPRIAPGSAAYNVPEYLGDVTDDRSGYTPATLEKTITEPGWQEATFALTEKFVFQTEAGTELADRLGIQSLRHLSPQQAVQLSTEFVRAVSRYERDTSGKPAGERADGMTTMQLLEEGLAHGGDALWAGNGVCRNIAANVKVVFDSLKALQGDYSMLRNTYCSASAGYGGRGYNDTRDNPFLTEHGRRDGHAWNIFTTVDKEGSASITIADATWALGSDSQHGKQAVDYTHERAADIVDQLFKVSSDKEAALAGVAEYYADMAKYRPGMQAATRRLEAFALERYLAIASTFPYGLEGQDVPKTLWAAAAHSANKLTIKELSTLYYHDKANGLLEAERLGRIVQNNYAKQDTLSAELSAERFAVAEKEFQTFLFDALGYDTVQKMAEVSSAIRIRLRERRPDLLPPFDPNANIADTRELVELAADAGITERTPKGIVLAARRRVRSLTKDDRFSEAIMAGRSDYDLVKSLSAIIRSLQKSR